MKLRRFTQLHESDEVVARWCVWLGPVLAWLTPVRRRLLLAAGAVWIGIVKPLEMMADAKTVQVPSDTLGRVLVVLALFGFLYLCYRAAVSFSSLPAFVRRRPQLTLHALFWCLLAVLWMTSPESGTWRAVLVGVAVVMPFLIWRCGYMLLSGQRGRAAETRFTDHLMYLWPVYGGSNTPFGKGLDYLAQREAKTDVDLARSQLAGVKLLVLSALWSLILKLMDAGVYGSPKGPFGAALSPHALGVPQLGQLIGKESGVSLILCWASLYFELIRQVLTHAVHGHSVIGVLRLFGFNVFRNTYKPLLAQSVVEFWNRYFYYFKELLVEFFFLPTFARRFKSRPKLRLFAAVFAAAFFGNTYYHMFQKEELVILGDYVGLWNTYHARLFYCLLLTVGLFVSMLRAQQRAGQQQDQGLVRQLVRMWGVWTFFALIFIWNARTNAPFSVRWDFFLNLFGLA